MNINRTDLFLVGIIFLQLQLLFELVTNLSYNAITEAVQGASVFSILEVIVFTAAVSFSLKGLLLAIDTFFLNDEAERPTQSRSAAYVLVTTAFLFVTMIILIRASTNY